MLDLPDPTATNLLQVLILAGGVYLLLTFLETTRGSGMVRGLGFALLLGGPAIWLLTMLFELEQLQHVLRAIAQVAVIVLVVLFAPELRRGIVRIGDNALIGRLLQRDHNAAVEEVVAAIVSMARDRVGALVAFERRVPLDPYIERGVRVNAEVNRLLLESLFHEGNKLHDGAVILRGDRVEAAACILPLSENQEISKSTGTRHRAALGLTEETDAVAVIVSEETGLISVCKEGAMERRVARDALEEVLRELLSPRAGTDEVERPSLGAQVKRLFTHRAAQKGIALGIGALLFLGAWRAERTERKFVLEVRFLDDDPSRTGEATGAGPGILSVVQPDDVRAVFLDEEDEEIPPEDVELTIRLDAPREVLQQLGTNEVSGRINLAKGETGLRELRPNDINWGPGRSFVHGDATVTWDGPPPRLSLKKYGVRDLRLVDIRLDVVDGGLDDGWEVDRPNVRLVPDPVRVQGPEGKPIDLGNGKSPFLPIEIESKGSSYWLAQPLWTQELQLTPELVQEGFELVGAAYAAVPILPQVLEVGEVEVDVAVVSLDTTDPDLAARYVPPREKVRIVVSAEGILTGRDEDDRLVRLALTGVVKQEGQAWVDVGGREVAVQTFPVRIRDIPREVWFPSLPAEVQERLSSARSQRLILRAEPETLELRPTAPTVDPGGDDQENGEDS